MLVLVVVERHNGVRKRGGLSSRGKDVKLAMQELLCSWLSHL